MSLKRNPLQPEDYPVEHDPYYRDLTQEPRTLYNLFKSEGVFDREIDLDERIDLAEELALGHYNMDELAANSALWGLHSYLLVSGNKQAALVINTVLTKLGRPEPGAHPEEPYELPPLSRGNPDDYEEDDEDIEVPPEVRKALTPEMQERIEGELVPGGMWIEWEKYYGCGAFGCVWPLLEVNTNKTTGIALKVTSDLTEGPTVAAIIESKLCHELNGLVRFYDIRRLPIRDHTWAFTREDIRPMDDDEDIDYAPWFPLLQRYTQLARQMLPESVKDRLRVYSIKQDPTVTAITLGRSTVEQINEVLDEMNEWPELEWVVEAIDSLRDFNIVLADLHPGNVGWRTHKPQKLSIAGRTHDFSAPQEVMEPVEWYDGEYRPPLLVFDVGVASAPAGTAIAPLSRKALRENPVLDAAYDWIPVLK